MSSPHDTAVAAISAKVGGFYKSRRPFRIYHGSTSSTRPSRRRADGVVDTSALDRVLSVDTAAKTAVVEPNVPMDALVAATLTHGLVPHVVMELPGITAGGGFSGTSGESSSFRYGPFDATCNWIEIVLPSGEVVRASRDGEKSDLFWGAASALGTLGVVTLLEVRLRDAARFVRLTYSLCSSAADADAAMQRDATAGTSDYLDAIVFAADTAVVCAGRLVDDLPPDSPPPRQFLRRRDPWFYLRAQEVTNKLRERGPDATETDHVPLVDYLFRYDRGAFWCGRYSFRYFFTPFNRATRLLLDRFMRTRVMYRALHESGLAAQYVVQDVGIPHARVAEFSRWLDESLHLYPLWLCPLRVRRDEGPDVAAHGIHADFGRPDSPAAADVLNFGVWGPMSADRGAAVRANRDLERKVLELGGKKCLYAHTYYPEDEFWAHYDRQSYDTIRARYDAAHLPSVYDKVRVDVDAEEAAARASRTARLRARLWKIRPIPGLYGAYKAVLGGDYLLAGGK